MALADQNVIDQLAELGSTPSSEDDATPEAHTKLLEEQIDLWRPIIEEAGVAGRTDHRQRWGGSAAPPLARP